MAIKYSETAINNQLDELTALIDAGSAAGTLTIYDGTRPADPDTVVTTQTALAVLTLSDPSAAAASGGVLTLSSITQDSSADATGTASWFRVADSDGTAVVDGDVGTSSSDLVLNSVSIVAGGAVSVPSFVITGGNA